MDLIDDIIASAKSNSGLLVTVLKGDTDSTGKVVGAWIKSPKCGHMTPAETLDESGICRCCRSAKEKVK